MKIVFSFLVLFTVISCAQKKEPLLGETDWQRQQNADFKDASKSPLKAKDRKNFKTLDFFPVDSSAIVKATLKRTPDSDWFLMQTTTDRVSNERVYGVVTFELQGKTFELSVYQGQDLMTQEGFENYLFLPFIDHTNGETTYGGGRYIDLRIPENDMMIIDFNKAYNPYCAYDEKYSCPIVPRNNYLDIEVKAGVKDFNKK
ncbi:MULTISPECIES: DUF1684 domain-containing protein [Bizionia]|uniref:DUF1684 domain-containing protein n=1 Tax=Bizionia algoritergicola TaxID=291187 RepID=A0A5D0QT13_9FLAO|nr:MULTISPECIES: DUF1684 domain-containing protein [Bizionia]OBX22061.1 hypothetical protein BAA08_10305 [Bizionia sp. APA-3]TYB72019.1 DUF1684 domain-containing protein [Bizionia algoritergicola]